jgi:hypothetical protein
MHLGDIGDSFLSFSMRGLIALLQARIILLYINCNVVTCVATNILWKLRNLIQIIKQSYGGDEDSQVSGEKHLVGKQRASLL